MEELTAGKDLTELLAPPAKAELDAAPEVPAAAVAAAVVVFPTPPLPV